MQLRGRAPSTPRVPPRPEALGKLHVLGAAVDGGYAVANVTLAHFLG
jgi:hypothetical protein